MEKIIKCPETMSSRERVIRTFNYEKTDRVTIGYHANPGIHQRLKDALGVVTDEQLFQALGEGRGQGAQRRRYRRDR